MAGQNPSMVIRVAATIAELRANLAEGKSQIETTTSAMQKLATSFSGDKLIQAANNVTAAVNQIGGASKLTEAEQARVNATLEKALEKYRVLGKEAPAGMQQLANDTKQVDQSSFKLTDTVKQLALGFAAMFTARAAFNFINQTLQEASALKDLSQQTHIGVEELQLLASAMSEFGVDADVLGNGLFALSLRIAKGEDSVTDALLQMGMSLKDVQGLEGEALFLTIERGLAKLHGSLRDTTAADLFGSRLGMAMAGASEGIDDAMESARRLNTVMGQDAVNALDRYDEAIKRAKVSLSAMAANMIGPVAEGFNVIFEAAGRGASKWDIFVAVIKDFATSNTVAGANTSHLAKLLDELNQKTDAGATTTKAVTEAHKEFVPALESTAGATKKARDETEAAQKAVDAYVDSVKKMISAHESAIASLANKLFGFDDIERAQQYMEALGGVENVSKLSGKAQEELAGVMRAGVEAMVASGLSADELTGRMEVFRLAATQTGRDASTAMQAIKDSAAEAARVLGQVSEGLTIVGQTPSFTPTPSSPGNFMFGSRTSSSPPSSLAQTGVVVFGGEGRAGGGSVSAGQPYMVGERGPELFVPGASGAIVPNGGGGSNITIAAGAVQINYPLMNDPRARMEIASMVGDALMARLRQQGLRVPSGA